MNPAILDQLTDELAAEVVAKAGPKLLAYLDARRTEKQEDPLLTVIEVAKRLRLGKDTIYKLIQLGDLHTAPHIAEFRIRQSEADAYGKRQKKQKPSMS